eukprot:TRINITY_DN2659_c0_g1_i1.p1 TRINITY_DN2659_c0_g1~~TRINITY_DN2659_c0_g1_i1.p1  ORF type:complete len:634 (+),score=89.08 TRINITY_DN2659_c0_g1_i1:12-1913(+)
MKPRTFVQMASKTLESLKFDNISLRCLPLDPEKKNFVRSPVPNTCFSLVEPTPVDKPQLVCASRPALKLIDITSDEEFNRDDFAAYFAGNKVLPGAEPAAHCYCGHQFGRFSGQLGDGATMFLGQVINEAGDRWEIQFKGAGKTPYSRTADGRKVLRSSIREFLCSEANFFLNVPTTRAGTVVTSDTRVERDIFYSGDVIRERASIVLRMAPTFIRFGSFEIFKGTADTGRAGPSEGNWELQKKLLDHVIDTFYPDIDKTAERATQYKEFFTEIVRRTAYLVAQWQRVGFCHGVLNTDNMSIVGLTIDYGPFGFMEIFNNDFICNSSDNSGRYSYAAQPEICKWNCVKLAEALHPTLPKDVSMEIIDSNWDKQYNGYFLEAVRDKLGLAYADGTPTDDDTAKDLKLYNDLLDVMQKTGADFTQSFNNLKLILQGSSADEFWEKQQKYVASPKELAEFLASQASIYKPSIPPMQLMMIMQLTAGDDNMLSQMFGGVDPATAKAEIQEQCQRIEKQKELKKRAVALGSVEADVKKEQDKTAWMDWLQKYQARLDAVVQPKQNADNAKKAVDKMKAANPALVLHNWVAQDAITKAEKGDYTAVNEVLKMLETPYTEAADDCHYAQPVVAKSGLLVS